MCAGREVGGWTCISGMRHTKSGMKQNDLISLTSGHRDVRSVAYDDIAKNGGFVKCLYGSKCGYVKLMLKSVILC